MHREFVSEIFAAHSGRDSRGPGTVTVMERNLRNFSSSFPSIHPTSYSISSALQLHVVKPGHVQGLEICTYVLVKMDNFGAQL